ncbi:hypothetical protein ALT717_220037 [Alteromonas macleodii]
MFLLVMRVLGAQTHVQSIVFFQKRILNDINFQSILPSIF